MHTYFLIIINILLVLTSSAVFAKPPHYLCPSRDDCTNFDPSKKEIVLDWIACPTKDAAIKSINLPSSDSEETSMMIEKDGCFKIKAGTKVWIDCGYAGGKKKCSWNPITDKYIPVRLKQNPNSKTYYIWDALIN